MKPSIVVLLMSAPAVALAHPGHGSLPADSLAHWIEPFHIALALAHVVIIALVVVELRAGRKRQAQAQD